MTIFPAQPPHPTGVDPDADYSEKNRIEEKRVESGFIAYLDVLGFRNFANQADSIEELSCQYKEYIINDAQMSQTLECSILRFDEKRVPRRMPDLERANTNMMILADSIIFWTESDGIQEFLDITHCVRYKLMRGIQFGFPLRGALTCGGFSTIRGGFFGGRVSLQISIIGKAFIRAYELESRSDWSGCIIEDGVAERYQSQLEKYFMENPLAPRYQWMNLDNFAVKYDVPWKPTETASPADAYCLNWLNIQNGIQDHEIVSAFSKHGKSVSSDAIRSKIANTLAFADFARRPVSRLEAPL